MATAPQIPSTKKTARLLVMSAVAPWLISCTRMLTQTASRLCVRRRQQLGATYGASLSAQTFPRRCGARWRTTHFKDASLLRATKASVCAIRSRPWGLGWSIGVLWWALPSSTTSTSSPSTIPWRWRSSPGIVTRPWAKVDLTAGTQPSAEPRSAGVVGLV